MGTIIYFEENPGKHGVIRFVATYCEKRWFRREKISYTLSVMNAFSFLTIETIEKVKEKIRRDFPDAKIYSSGYEEFISKYESHEFWSIARYGDNGFEGANEPDGYFVRIGKSKVEWTEDINDAEICLVRSNMEETLNVIRGVEGVRAALFPIYLNLINELLTPIMMIVCTSRKGKQETKYFSKIEGNRLRLVTTSYAAKMFTYQDAQDTFEYLRTHNKNFWYAILPKFKENVHCRDVEGYFERNKLSRSVVVSIKVGKLNG